jgi:cellulose synthase operon protein YhjU
MPLEPQVKPKSDPHLPHWSAYLGGLRKQVGPSREDFLEEKIAVEPEPVVHLPPVSTRISLEIWSFYFIAKLILFGMGYIAFHALENLAFAGFVLLTATVRPWRNARNLAAIGLAISLLYYDSWLPPIGRLFSQASVISDFSFSYLVELLLRFLNFSVLGLLFLAWGGYRLVSRWVRVGVLVVSVMAVLGIVQHLPENPVTDASRPDMDKVLQEFFAQESQRSVLLTPPPAGAVPFDLVFIHVCSLSWDDVQAVGLEQHPLWRRFDIRMTRFNSATSYSGPAAIHLLRATCGQQEHGQMYSPVPEKCYLMNSLLRAGFEPNTALNHDGKFDDFLGQVQMYGRLMAPPMGLTGVEVTQNAFDGSPIYDDLSVLNRWLDTRQTSSSSRVAMYYNTVTLHDGNMLVNQSGANSLENYKLRLSGLLDGIDRFMENIEKSGRRMVVVMVPEHGAALRGDKKQIAGLREIPTPAITLVPVGIRVVGGGVQRRGEALSIDEPTSYLAISHIVERMLEKSPFDAEGYSPAEYVSALPLTPFVSQGESVIVAEYNQRYYQKQAASGWE